ncbi:MAG: hypothetical protein E7265_09710 [Lachnospiraceae bacterium]|nr:hypothetical protein [Lachnospiraceae bacterium]
MKSGKKYFWGLMLIATGLFLLLNQMGLITATLNAVHVLIGVVCVLIAVNSIFDRSIGGFFCAVGLAWITFDDVIGLPNVSIWMIILILILLTAGFHCILPKKKKDYMNFCNGQWTGCSENYSGFNCGGENVNDASNTGNGQNVGGDNSKYVYFCNRFGSAAKYVNATDLQSARLENSFGELKVYFDNTIILNSPIEINVNNSFGEMHIFVPRDWCVENNINVFLGDVKKNTGYTGSTSPVVRITGSVSFGELQISYI